jgi:hypothetical protein
VQILVLIEPTAAGQFRARTGEPLSASSFGASADEAKQRLEALLCQRLQNGSQLATINLDKDSPEATQPPLDLEPIPDNNWFFQSMREAIAENRQHEDKAAGS